MGAQGRTGRRPLRGARRRRGPASPDRRLRVGLLLILFVLSLYGGRLIQLQGLDASALAAAALSERSTTVTLPAHRGDIVDRNGAVLATTVERWNVLVDQTLIKDYAVNEHGRQVVKGIPGAARVLAPLVGLPVAEVESRLTGTRRGAYLAKNVTTETYRQVLRTALPGIGGERASRRDYPGGEVGANVVGVVGSEGKGLAGIEFAYDHQLSGTDGSLTYERGQDGVSIPNGVVEEVEPKEGRSVQLTIDRDLQWRAQQLLDAQVAKVKAQWGTATILDARTGQVLALANSPTFDPNHVAGASKEQMTDESLTDVFEPGSTNKVITASAALQEGVATPLTKVTVPGTLFRAGHTFHDAEPHGVEKLTFAGVLAKSSNIGTMLVGEKLSASTLHDYMARFGLGSHTGVGLEDSAGILTPAAAMNGTQRYTVMFGQGVSVTALQVASVYQTIANGGVRVPPRLVAATTDADGTVHPAAAAPATRVVSSSTAEQVTKMLENVVSDQGTAMSATVPGYTVAGKTGTAQAADSRCGCYRGYTATFVGFAPAENPRFVISVVMQQPQLGHYGSTVSAPVFQPLMTYALAHAGVAPTGTRTPALPVTWK